MVLVSQIGHFFKDVGRDVQCRFESAVMDLIDFTRPASGVRSEGADDVPDLPSSMASFERMLRFLEEKRAWPDESLHLEGSEDFDDWRNRPLSIGDGKMASTAAF
jgi:hypothetical protein